MAVKVKSFFRYPGGKAKIKTPIIAKIKSMYENNMEYREPFFGGGSIGLNMFQSVRAIWINDKDPGIVCLWNSVKDNHDLLKSKVSGFTPSIDAFYEFREYLLSHKGTIDNNEMVEVGFRKLVIHQISYSGLGLKSGGPLGGREQKSQYKIDCRWAPLYINKKIDIIHSLLLSLPFRCTCGDFKDLLNDDTSAVIYLDPPYYIKGNDMYEFGFTKNDHKRLSELLRKPTHSWVLSYDDCQDVREMYSWAHVEEIKVNYTITSSREKNELLISSR